MVQVNEKVTRYFNSSSSLSYSYILNKVCTMSSPSPSHTPCPICKAQSFETSTCRKQNDMSNAFKVTCTTCKKFRTFCRTCDRFIKESEQSWSTHIRQSKQHKSRIADLEKQHGMKQQDKNQVATDNGDSMDIDEMMLGENDGGGLSGVYTVDGELLRFCTTVPQYNENSKRLTLPSFGEGFNEQLTHEALMVLEERATFLGLDSRCVTSMNPLLNKALAPTNLLEFVASGWEKWFTKNLCLHKSSESILPDFDTQVDNTVLHMHLNCFLSVISSTTTNFQKIANTNKAIQQASVVVVLQQLKKKYGIDIKIQVACQDLSDDEFLEAMNNDVLAQLKLATTDNEVHNCYIEQLFRRWPTPNFRQQLNYKGEDVGLDVNNLLQIMLFHFQRKNISIHASYAEEAPSIIKNTHDSPAITGRAVPLQYKDVVVWKLNCHNEKGKWICFNYQDAQKIWAAKKVRYIV